MDSSVTAAAAAAAASQPSGRMMMLPLQLSPHGVVSAHASFVLKHPPTMTTTCCYDFMVAPDHQKWTPYYHPGFWCTSRAICAGPGDTILCIFPQDSLVYTVAHEMDLETSTTELVWTILLTCQADHPFIFPRHTNFENVCSHPGIQSQLVVLHQSTLTRIRGDHATLLTPPVSHILGFPPHHLGPTATTIPALMQALEEEEEIDDEEEVKNDDGEEEGEIVDEEENNKEVVENKEEEEAAVALIITAV